MSWLLISVGHYKNHCVDKRVLKGLIQTSVSSSVSWILPSPHPLKSPLMLSKEATSPWSRPCNKKYFEVHSTIIATCLLTLGVAMSSQYHCQCLHIHHLNRFDHHRHIHLHSLIHHHQHHHGVGPAWPWAQPCHPNHLHPHFLESPDPAAEPGVETRLDVVNGPKWTSKKFIMGPEWKS